MPGALRKSPMVSNSGTNPRRATGKLIDYDADARDVALVALALEHLARRSDDLVAVHSSYRLDPEYEPEYDEYDPECEPEPE